MAGSAFSLGGLLARLAQKTAAEQTAAQAAAQAARQQLVPRVAQIANATRGAQAQNATVAAAAAGAPDAAGSAFGSAANLFRGTAPGTAGQTPGLGFNTVGPVTSRGVPATIPQLPGPMQLPATVAGQQAVTGNLPVPRVGPGTNVALRTGPGTNVAPVAPGTAVAPRTGPGTAVGPVGPGTAVGPVGPGGPGGPLVPGGGGGSGFGGAANAVLGATIPFLENIQKDIVRTEKFIEEASGPVHQTVMGQLDQDIKSMEDDFSRVGQAISDAGETQRAVQATGGDAVGVIGNFLGDALDTAFPSVRSKYNPRTRTRLSEALPNLGTAVGGIDPEQKVRDKDGNIREPAFETVKRNLAAQGGLSNIVGGAVEGLKTAFGIQGAPALPAGSTPEAPPEPDDKEQRKNDPKDLDHSSDLIPKGEEEVKEGRATEETTTQVTAMAALARASQENGDRPISRTERVRAKAQAKSLVRGLGKEKRLDLLATGMGILAALGNRNTTGLGAIGQGLQAGRQSVIDEQTAAQQLEFKLAELGLEEDRVNTGRRNSDIAQQNADTNARNATSNRLRAEAARISAQAGGKLRNPTISKGAARGLIPPSINIEGVDVPLNLGNSDQDGEFAEAIAADASAYMEAAKLEGLQMTPSDAVTAALQDAYKEGRMELDSAGGFLGFFSHTAVQRAQ